MGVVVHCVDRFEICVVKSNGVLISQDDILYNAMEDRYAV